MFRSKILKVAILIAGLAGFVGLIGVTQLSIDAHAQGCNGPNGACQ